MTSERTEPSARKAITRDEIRDQWAWVAGDWARWEPYLASSFWPVRQRLMAQARLRPGMRVLDIGCGIGDPGLPIASAVAPGGSVLGIDLASEMIEIASARARALDITNVEFRAAALEDVGEPVGSFDAVVMQFTIMFLTDIPAGLRKVHDLLCPGGRVAVSAWAPMNVNPMFSIPKARFAAVVDLPKARPDAPGPMRLSRAGELEGALAAAGFTGVDAADVKFYNFAKNPGEYFELTYALTPMFRRTFDSLPAGEQRQVREGLMAAVAQFQNSTGVRVPAMARVGAAAKLADGLVSEHSVTSRPSRPTTND